MPSSRSQLPKLVLLGDAGVGKSALVQVATRRTGRSSSIKSIRPTIAPDRVVADVGPIADGSRSAKVELCDRPGSHMQPTVLKRFYDGCSGALLVYDVANAASLGNTRKWLHELREYTAQNCPVVLVGNKSDLAEAGAPGLAAELAAELRLTHQLTASALDGSGVAVAFTALTEAVLGIRRGPEAEPEPEPEAEPEPEPEPERERESESEVEPAQLIGETTRSFRSVFRRRPSQRSEPAASGSSSSRTVESAHTLTPAEPPQAAAASDSQSGSELVPHRSPDLASTARIPAHSPSTSTGTEGSDYAKLPTASSSVGTPRTAQTARSPSPQVTVRVKKTSATSHVQTFDVAEPTSREERHAAAIKVAEAKRQRQQERDDRIALLEKEREARTAWRKQRLIEAQSNARPFRVASQIPRHRSPQPHKARDIVHCDGRSPARQPVAFGSASPSGRLASDEKVAGTTGRRAGASAPRDHSISRQKPNTRGRERSATPTSAKSQARRVSADLGRDYRLGQLSTPTRRRPLSDDSSNLTNNTSGLRSRSTPTSRNRSKSPSPSVALAFGSKPPAKEPNPTLSKQPREMRRNLLKKDIDTDPMARKMMGIWKSEVRMLSCSA